MNKYTIYCNPSQTRKALELGAPIEESIDYHTDGHLITTGYILNGDVNDKNLDGFGWANTLRIPIAEQMIGWLEDRLLEEVHIEQDIDGMWNYTIYGKGSMDLLGPSNLYPSRKEATLAAIDAALEYLENQIQ